jgi:hypothetical protein
MTLQTRTTLRTKTVIGQRDIYPINAGLCSGIICESGSNPWHYCCTSLDPYFGRKKTWVSGPILILFNLTGILDHLPNIDPCPSPRKFALIGPLFGGSLDFQKWRVQLSISLAKKTIIHATFFWIKARNKKTLALQCCMCCNPTNDRLDFEDGELFKDNSYRALSEL